ncbi:hypothetical protein C5810_005090 [Salmonella enterica subsp. enterica serovar Monschaui]|nr:hypothetical protein [Salmonella enterica]EDV1680772.1 hypothetical protein [Salmonella enterica subsp. enterica serovar Monschaui]EDX3322160.1 hypothetical protein [Salmonella enterica subsp. enterica serovar Anatum]EJB7764825.1 hypothetical protein [Salmonella enterica]
MFISINRVFPVLVFTVSIAVCATSSARPLTENERKAVESGVSNELKDPYSAKFTHGDYPAKKANGIYCGKVNARNSYGAYIGNKLFAVMIMKMGDNDYMAPLVGDISNQEVVASTCASGGYDLRINKALKKSVNDERKAKGFEPLANEYFY